MTPQAYDFAAAESALATANTTTEKAAAELSALQARLAEKNQSLAMIQQRRLDGGELESDGSTIHLLMLDIAGLEPLVASARDRQQSACEAQQQAQMAVQQAQVALERAQALEAATALEARLRELEALLMSGIAELHTLKKAATGSIHVHGQTLYDFSQKTRRFIQTGVISNSH